MLVSPKDERTVSYGISEIHWSTSGDFVISS
jgi:hypothetical protein